MRVLLAKTFKFLFRSDYFRSKFFGIHEKLFMPYNLFKGVTMHVQINGLKLELHIDDWIQENLYFLGHYEKAELAAISKFITPESIFIDVGANLGLYTLFASKEIGKNGKIISFEPFGENYKSLCNNIAINNLTNVKVEKLAVGEKDGCIKLYYDAKEKNRGMVSVNYLKNGASEDVQMVSLDSYFAKNAPSRIDFIKIDIEGHEYAALLGMKNLLKTYHPTLIIEILENKDDSSNSDKINAFFEELGYTKYFIDDEGNLSLNEINPSRVNYILTTQPVGTN